MFGFNYRCELNETQDIIKIRPTVGTIAKTSGLSYLYLLAVGAVVSYWMKSLARQRDALVTEDTTPTE